MKRMHLRTQLSAGFALIVFVVIALVSISANVLIRIHFEQYIENEQARFSQELTENLANQYDASDNSWNLDYIHGAGMYAVNDGYFLKVLDSEHNILWNIEQHDMQCCEDMMYKIGDTMSKMQSADGSFVSHEYPMYQGNILVGYAEITYYTPYYMNENAFRFLDSLNLILAVTAAISLVCAVAAGIMFARDITKPVTEVIENTGKIAEGNFSVKPESRTGSAELYELTQAVKAMTDTLERQEKLRKRLTGDVAHELRTPLTNIASQLEMMSDGIWQPTPERITSCYEEIRRISSLVDDMEKLHKIDSDNLILHKSKFSMKTMIESVIQSFAKELSDKEISITLECNEITLNADRNRLIQVMTNLLSNSVKYTGYGGTITVKAKQNSGYFELTISDNGTGISYDDLPYIFERFYRADKSRNRSTGGSGIGLAVTKAIVEAHGGIIKADSVYGKGSEFSLSLPVE